MKIEEDDTGGLPQGWASSVRTACDRWLKKRGLLNEAGYRNRDDSKESKLQRKVEAVEREEEGFVSP